MLLLCFQAQGETFPSWIVTAEETWFHHFELETKSSPQNGTVITLPRRKNSDISYQWERSWSLSSVIVQEGFLWQRCWDWRQSTLLMPICLQNSKSVVSNDLGLTRFQENHASAWQCKAAYKCEDPGSHYEICLESITPSSLQPQSSTFRFPPILSPDGCTLHYKVWEWWQSDLHMEIFATWARQGMILTKHTHTCSSLAQHHRSGWRLCGIIGYGVKPSLFIMDNFHKLAINFYWDKN